MDDDYLELAVFDDRATALEALRLLQNNGIGGFRSWPRMPEAGAISPYVVDGSPGATSPTPATFCCRAGCRTCRASV